MKLHLPLRLLSALLALLVAPQAYAAAWAQLDDEEASLGTYGNWSISSSNQNKDITLYVDGETTETSSLKEVKLSGTHRGNAHITIGNGGSVTFSSTCLGSLNTKPATPDLGKTVTIDMDGGKFEFNGSSSSQIANYGTLNVNMKGSSSFSSTGTTTAQIAQEGVLNVNMEDGSYSNKSTLRNATVNFTMLGGTVAQYAGSISYNHTLTFRQEGGSFASGIQMGSGSYTIHAEYTISGNAVHSNTGQILGSSSGNNYLLYNVEDSAQVTVANILRSASGAGKAEINVAGNALFKVSGGNGICSASNNNNSASITLRDSSRFELACTSATAGNLNNATVDIYDAAVFQDTGSSVFKNTTINMHGGELNNFGSFSGDINIDTASGWTGKNNRFLQMGGVDAQYVKSVKTSGVAMMMGLKAGSTLTLANAENYMTVGLANLLRGEVENAAKNAVALIQFNSGSGTLAFEGEGSLTLHWNASDIMKLANGGDSFSTKIAIANASSFSGSMSNFNLGAGWDAEIQDAAIENGILWLMVSGKILDNTWSASDRDEDENGMVTVTPDDLQDAGMVVVDANMHLDMSNSGDESDATLNLLQNGDENDPKDLLITGAADGSVVELHNEDDATGNSGSTSFAGNITADEHVTLDKTGAAAFTMDGNLTTEGDLKVSDGRFVVGSASKSSVAGGLSALEGELVVNGSLELGGESDLRDATGSISGSGDIRLTGSMSLGDEVGVQGVGMTLADAQASLTLDGTGVEDSTLAVDSGVLKIKDGSSLKNSTVEVKSGTLELGAAELDDVSLKLMGGTLQNLSGEAVKLDALQGDSTVVGDAVVSSAGEFSGTLQNGTLTYAGAQGVTLKGVDGSTGDMALVSGSSVMLSPEGAATILKSLSVNDSSIALHVYAGEASSQLVVAENLDLQKDATVEFTVHYSGEDFSTAAVECSGCLVLGGGSRFVFREAGSVLPEGDLHCVLITSSAIAGSTDYVDIEFAPMMELYYDNLRLEVESAEAATEVYAMRRAAAQQSLVLRGDERTENNLLPVALTSTAMAGSRLIFAARTNPQMLWQGSELNRLTEAVLTQAKTNPAAASRTMAAVAGSTVTSLGAAQRDALRGELLRLRTHATAATPEKGKVTTWLEGNGAFNSLHNDGDMSGYRLNSWGGTVGASMKPAKDAMVGLALSAQYGDLEASAADSAKGHLDGYYLSFLSHVQHNAWGHSFIATIARNEAKLNRTVDYGTGSYATHGKTDGEGFGAVYELTYDMPLSAGSIFQPLVNVSIVSTSMEAYSESGADGAGLRVNEQKWITGSVAVGARWLGKVGESLFGRSAQAELRANISQDMGDNQGSANVALLADPLYHQQVKGAKVGRTALQMGAGIAVPVSESSSVYTNVNADLRSGSHQWNVNAGVRFGF